MFPPQQGPHYDTQSQRSSQGQQDPQSQRLGQGQYDPHAQRPGQRQDQYDTQSQRSNQGRFDPHSQRSSQGQYESQGQRLGQGQDRYDTQSQRSGQGQDRYDPHSQRANQQPYQQDRYDNQSQRSGQGQFPHDRFDSHSQGSSSNKFDSSGSYGYQEPRGGPMYHHPNTGDKTSPQDMRISQQQYDPRLMPQAGREQRGDYQGDRPVSRNSQNRPLNGSEQWQQPQYYNNSGYNQRVNQPPNQRHGPQGQHPDRNVRDSWSERPPSVNQGSYPPASINHQRHPSQQSNNQNTHPSNQTYQQPHSNQRYTDNSLQSPDRRYSERPIDVPGGSMQALSQDRNQPNDDDVSDNGGFTQPQNRTWKGPKDFR